MDKPKIVALPMISDFRARSNKIIFYQNDYPNNKKSFFVVDYGSQQFGNKINFSSYKHHSWQQMMGKEYNPKYLDCFDNLLHDSHRVCVDDILKLDFDQNIKNFISEVCSKDKYYNGAYIWEWNNLYVLYWDSGSSAIISASEVIYYIDDVNYSYQMGDHNCYVIDLENGDFMIYNSGDVYSAIIFTKNNPQVHIYEIPNENQLYDLAYYLKHHGNKAKLSTKLLNNLTKKLIQN